jgi:hypothetical protein
MPTWTVKRRDTGPFIADTLLDSSGAPVNVTGARGKFHMATWDLSTVLINAAITGPSGGALDTTGQFEYHWASADTLANGVFLAEVEITYADGTIETFPNGGHAVVSIEADLA